MRFPDFFSSQADQEAAIAKLYGYLDFLEGADDRLIKQHLRHHTHYYAPYAIADVTHLQRRFGRIYQRWVEAHPTFTEPLGRSRRGRVGVVCLNLKASAGVSWIWGWVDALPEIEWRIYTLSPGQPPRDRPNVTVKVLPGDVRRAGALIRQDAPHSLIYPELGHNVVITKLAACRLALVQCAGWGYPVTSGLPSMDYYLSGEALEVPHAQEHYTEQLIRLPGSGLLLPPIPTYQRDRAHWGFADNETVILCAQNPAKFQPENDWVYRAIARSVPHPVFILVNYPSNRAASLRRRLNLNIRVFDWMHRSLYRRLVACADVALDCPGWSGANTTLDAVAQGVPVVTYPGEFMRSRVSAGLFQHGILTATAPSQLPGLVAQALHYPRRPQQLSSDKRAIADTLLKLFS